MKAIVYKKYGPPDVLHIEDVPKPVPGDRDIRIKVLAVDRQEPDEALES